MGKRGNNLRRGSVKGLGRVQKAFLLWLSNVQRPVTFQEIRAFRFPSGEYPDSYIPPFLAPLIKRGFVRAIPGYWVLGELVTQSVQETLKAGSTA